MASIHLESGAPWTELPRSPQPCDADCAFFGLLDPWSDRGWCRDPRCPALERVTRIGRECPRFAVRPAGTGPQRPAGLLAGEHQNSDAPVDSAA